MSTESVATMPEMQLDTFARSFSMRSPNLMWFLGAGASAAAGIPTAWDMIWEFKQKLYVSQRRVPAQSVADLSNPTIRDRIQVHIDSLGDLPTRESADEYATLFETVYPSEADRRIYIDAKISGGKPSFGHFALAHLLEANLARIVWTTNFDPLIADACARVYGGTGPLTVAALEQPDVARQCLNEGRWPLEVKLHGDFRSRRLKNTQDELRNQDAQMRSLFVNACRRFGIVVAGYSGRDNSVMDAFEEVLGTYEAFPAGLFWLHRGHEPPFPRVASLIKKASSQGVEASLVRIANFDEVLRDLLRLLPIDDEKLRSFGSERPRVSDATIPIGKTGWPVIRLNAIRVSSYPTVCRRIKCKIGGYREVRNALESASVKGLAGRSSSGVLFFGSDVAAKAAFRSYKISDFDLHPIEPRRLRYDSAERGLLRQAICNAIESHGSLVHIRRRHLDLLYPKDASDPRWLPLKKLVGSLSGTVPKSKIRWYEGIATRLEWAGDNLWLLVEPRTVLGETSDEDKFLASGFARERSVKRYNRTLNDLVDFWTNLLVGDGDEIKALGVTTGIDASFKLSKPNAFSRRVGV